METQTFVIREAIPSDAKELLQVMKVIGGETPFLIMDEEGIDISVDEMFVNLEKLYDCQNNIFMVALADDKIIGTASVKASLKKRMEHIGELGISILKEYWGYGVGNLLMEELLIWARDSGVIRRLELTVQHRNQRAIHLYEKIGFHTEAIMPRGAKTDDGEFLDVHLMSLMVD